MVRAAYPSDLTDRQWFHLEPLIPAAKSGGRPRTLEMREVINAVLYVLRSGCAWRMLPHDFPCWSSAYYYFWRFRRDGVWQRVHDALRDGLRLQEGRQVSPSAAIMDSQSVKTDAPARTPARGS